MSDCDMQICYPQGLQELVEADATIMILIKLIEDRLVLLRGVICAIGRPYSIVAKRNTVVLQALLELIEVDAVAIVIVHDAEEASHAQNAGRSTRKQLVSQSL